MNDRFKEHRRLQGKTQIDLAVAVGISPSIVHAFEKGDPKRLVRLSPRIKTKLAEAYGVTVDEINAACAQPEHERIAG